MLSWDVRIAGTTDMRLADVRPDTSVHNPAIKTIDAPAWHATARGDDSSLPPTKPVKPD